MYTAAGAVSSMQLGNGRWESTAFNSRLQPVQIALGSTQNATDLLKLEYGYGTTDNNGNVVSQTITVPGMTYPLIQSYAYDELNRISAATETSNGTQVWSQSFGYDRYGNRNITAGQGQTSLTFSSTNNRITTSGYAFDNSGNTTRDPGRTFVYDAENKQVAVSNKGGVIGEYSYDGDGKRVKKVSTSDSVRFVYDAAGKLIEEYDAGSGTLTTAYVYAGSRLLTTETVSGTNYLTADHLGSPRINTDSTGTVTARHDYMPFGEEIVALGNRTPALGYTADTIRKQFTGYERDTESSLDFAQARMYNFQHGRLTSPDPYNVILEKERGEDEDERADILIGFISNPQRWNMYVYVVNNPLAFTDPDGQKPRTINVFLDAGVLTKEGLEEWQKWAASAQKKDKELTVNIYQISKDTPGTVNAFLDSLKAKDTATIFMGHSTSSNGQRLGIHFNTGGDIGSRGGGLSKTADGIDIQNTVLAVFSCGFGNGFDNIASSNGTAFVSIVQGPEATTRSDATNAAAFRFAKSIARGSWDTLRLPGELNVAVAQSQSGINAYPSPDRPSVMAGDHVNYRILPPPRKKR